MRVFLAQYLGLRPEDTLAQDSRSSSREEPEMVGFADVDGFVTGRADSDLVSGCIRL